MITKKRPKKMGCIGCPLGFGDLGAATATDDAWRAEQERQAIGMWLNVEPNTADPVNTARMPRVVYQAAYPVGIGALVLGAVLTSMKKRKAGVPAMVLGATALIGGWMFRRNIHEQLGVAPSQGGHQYL